MRIELSQGEDGLAPRAIDALIVAALFIGNALLALWSIRPTLF